MTPRKPRQRQHHPGPSQLQQVQASDYDSETPILPDVHPTTRTNTDLNLSVLKRYNASIHEILSIAGSCTMYSLSKETHAWDKAGVEGTLFVCRLLASPNDGAENFCVVILNRKGLNNMIYDMRELLNVEISDTFLLFSVLEKGDSDKDAATGKIYGMHIHSSENEIDETDTRETNCLLIKNCWEKAREKARDTVGDAQAP